MVVVLAYLTKNMIFELIILYNIIKPSNLSIFIKLLKHSHPSINLQRSVSKSKYSYLPTSIT